MKNPESHSLSPGRWCPNNPERPLLIFRNTSNGSGEQLAEHFEKTFARNGWPPAWRYTVYDYPHYHSTTHEVIGVFRGKADVHFGDDAGFTPRLSAGDVVVIPAGVSHQRLWQTNDFQGVGAYPAGYEPDEIRKDSDAMPKDIAARIAKLGIPNDPLSGEEGPLVKIWSEASQGSSNDAR